MAKLTNLQKTQWHKRAQQTKQKTSKEPPSINTQQIPSKITKYIDRVYAGWRKGTTHLKALNNKKVDPYLLKVLL